jgi:DNA polymerase-3 subunit gamma/tau
MGQALYRKYRSKSLSEIVGQEHITTTLQHALKEGRISHAYLFTGPRGVGKTSIARILAHEINQLPYEDESMHLDIIEIDAASNRRIDEMRELRDKVYVAPTSATYKVYIIDEVHMLTKEAFNALLKTLEEPPAHVVFILATTDAHKLPDTIISRTQRYSFRPVERTKVIAHLREIAGQEKIVISDDALGQLADHGEGSFRDSISLLDQASSLSDSIERSDVQRLLGIPPEEAITGLMDGLATNCSIPVMAQKLAALSDQGFQAAGIAKALSRKIRQELIDQPALSDAHQSLQLLAKLIDVPSAYDPERFLEICLLSAITSAEPTPLSKTPDRIKPLEQVGPANPKARPPQPAEPTAMKPSTETKKATSTPPTQAIDDTLWPNILDALKQRYNTLYGVVRIAHPTFKEGDILELAFAFAFHQKRINDAKNQKIISDIILQLSGHAMRIVCILDKDLPASPHTSAKATKNESDELSAISNIFGGGERIER